MRGRSKAKLPTACLVFMPRLLTARTDLHESTSFYTIFHELKSVLMYMQMLVSL